MSNWTNPNIQQVTPLFSLGSVSGTGAITISAGGLLTVLSLADVSAFSSYDINTYGYAVTPGNAGSPFNCQIQLQWFDDLVSGIPVFEEDWWPWIGRAAINSIGVGPTGANPLAGSGPMHGRYLTVTVALKAADTTGMVLQWLNLFGSNRPLPYSDWRQNVGVVNPQVNNLTIQPPSNLPSLGYDNVIATATSIVIPANVIAFIPFNLYAGPVYYRFQASVAPQNAPTICVLGGLTGGQASAGSGSPNILTSFAADAADHEGTIILPRAVCALIVRAPTAATTTISCQVTGQQAA